MRSRMVAGLLTLMIAVVFVAGESAAQAKGPKPKTDGIVLPITGKTLTAGTLDGGVFDGMFALQRFASDANGGIVAVGMISGTVVTSAGVIVGTVFTGPVSLPVADPRLPRTGLAPAASGTRAVWDNEAPALAPGIVLAQATTCNVLNLAIGTVDLNVLGLVVHTDPIALQISGDTGGALGALLCTVLNAVGSIVNLLNTVLGLLGGLTGGLGA
jgi:hypothetical protein